MEKKKEKTKLVTREVAETISPTQGMAANDGIIISDRTDHDKDKQSMNAVQSEIQKTQKDISKISEMYKGIDMSNVMADLAQDKQSLSILAQKNVYQNLLQGEVVQVKHVSTDNSGKPRHFFGYKLLQLDRQIQSNKPVLNIGFSTFDSLNLPESLKIKNHSLKINPDFGKIISNLLRKDQKGKDPEIKEVINDLNKTLESNKKPAFKAHKLNVQLSNVADFYFKNDPVGRKTFLEQTGKQFVLVQNQNIALKDLATGKEAFHLRKHEIPVTGLPIKYKGVQLNEKQVSNLLIGNSIELTGIKDPNLAKPYSATVKFNLITGNQFENNKSIGQELIKGNNIEAKKALLIGSTSETIKNPEQAKKVIEKEDKKPQLRQRT